MSPCVYLFNTIISKLAKARKADFAIQLFHRMKATGFTPSSITYGAACARVGGGARWGGNDTLAFFQAADTAMQ